MARDVKSTLFNPSFTLGTACEPDFRVSGSFNAFKSPRRQPYHHLWERSFATFCWLRGWFFSTTVMFVDSLLALPPLHFLCLRKYFSIPHGFVLQVGGSPPLTGTQKNHTPSPWSFEMTSLQQDGTISTLTSLSYEVHHLTCFGLLRTHFYLHREFSKALLNLTNKYLCYLEYKETQKYSGSVPQGHPGTFISGSPMVFTSQLAGRGKRGQEENPAF